MTNEANQKQFRPATIVFSLLLALSLMLSAVPLTPVAAQDDCDVTHTVVAGDTLSYIASLYQVTWEEIARVNNLQAPYVIAAGTVLCIPGATDTTTGTTTTTTKKTNEPTMTVTPSFNNIHLAVTNFVKNTPYYVRVHSGSAGVSYRIGNFTTDKNGDFADFFRLPNYVPRTLDMRVCVKNTWTDAVSCVGLSDVEPFIGALLRIRCAKEGR